MLINVKMPTIVDNLTFISMINTSESLKAKKSLIIAAFYLISCSVVCLFDLI